MYIRSTLRSGRTPVFRGKYYYEILTLTVTRIQKSILILAVFAVLGIVSYSVATVTITRSLQRQVIAPQLATVSLSGSLSDDFTFYPTVTATVTQGAFQGTTSVKDIVYNSYTSASVLYSCTLTISGNRETPTYTSINPTIATVDSGGVITYVSNGTANFNAKVGRRTRAAACNMSSVTGSTSSTFYSYTSTSTAGEISGEISSRISGLTPSSSTYNLYSATDDTNHTYTRNTSLFASDVDWTMIPVYTANAGTQTMGVLVAPDIIIQANHTHPSGTIYFVTSSNTTVSRTISSGTNVSGTDIYVARLDSAVPAGVSYAKIFPANMFTNKVTADALTYQAIPVIFTNQFRTLRIGTMRFASVYSSSLASIGVVRATSTDSVYYSWYSVPVGGDSGLPAFGLINGVAVFLGNWYSADSVPNISYYISEINSAITSLGSSYSLTTIDLSSFPTY